MPNLPDYSSGEVPFDLTVYYPIFLFLAIILALGLIILILAHTIGPWRPTAVKLMPYESGMDPIGSTRKHFDVKFYLTAILFLVFDVELLFLYPWAVIAYRDQTAVPAALSRGLPLELRPAVFWEILIFLATLALAYVYAWRKGVFQWR